MQLLRKERVGVNDRILSGLSADDSGASGVRESSLKMKVLCKNAGCSFQANIQTWKASAVKNTTRRETFVCYVVKLDILLFEVQQIFITCALVLAISYIMITELYTAEPEKSKASFGILSAAIVHNFLGVQYSHCPDDNILGIRTRSIWGMGLIYNTIRVNRPVLGRTVPRYSTFSRCPTLHLRTYIPLCRFAGVKQQGQGAAQA